MSVNMLNGVQGPMPNPPRERSRLLTFKSDDQVYGQVIRMLEDGRHCEAMCSDDTVRTCLFRPSPRVQIGPGDIILVGIWNMPRVILKYLPDEVRLLKTYGELPENMNINAQGIVQV